MMKRDDIEARLRGAKRLLEPASLHGALVHAVRLARIAVHREEVDEPDADVVVILGGGERKVVEIRHEVRLVPIVIARRGPETIRVAPATVRAVIVPDEVMVIFPDGVVDGRAA